LCSDYISKSSPLNIEVRFRPRARAPMANT
jgi:hypothetical protein